MEWVIGGGVILLLFGIVLLYGRSQRKQGASAAKAKVHQEASANVIEANKRRQTVRGSQSRNTNDVLDWVRKRKHRKRSKS